MADFQILERLGHIGVFIAVIIIIIIRAVKSLVPTTRDPRDRLHLELKENVAVLSDNVHALHHHVESNHDLLVRIEQHLATQTTVLQDILEHSRGGAGIE